MKYFLRLLIIVIPACLWLNACKKEEKVEIPKEFPVHLDAERLEVRAETRLFSNNSEIKDKAVIQGFEEREALNELLEVPFQQQGQEDGLRFDSELVARFLESEDEENLFDIERKGTRFLFFSRNTYLVNPQAAPEAGSLGYFHGMLEYSDKLGEPTFGGMRPTREVRVAHGNYKVLKVSAMAYVLKLAGANGTDLAVFVSKGNLFNEFNDNVIKHLKQNDTLAVKEYSIIYSLRK